MQISMLVEYYMKPMPTDITIVQNYGLETVFRKDKPSSSGECMLLEGSKTAFINWLKPFNRIWIGNGLVGFQVMHIKNFV